MTAAIMLHPDFDTTMRNIVIAINAVWYHGLEPKRLYMNQKTYDSLYGIFHRAPIVMIPDGTARTPTIYGVRIAISDDLPDNYIDISVNTI